MASSIFWSRNDEFFDVDSYYYNNDNNDDGNNTIEERNNNNSSSNRIEKQTIRICHDCLKAYQDLTMHRLVVSDRIIQAEMSIIEKYKNKGNVDFYETVKDAFNNDESVRYFFNNDVNNIHGDFRRLWPLLFELQDQAQA